MPWEPADMVRHLAVTGVAAALLLAALLAWEVRSPSEDAGKVRWLPVVAES